MNQQVFDITTQDNADVNVQTQRGFSFLEVMIVLVLIGGIAGLASTFLFPQLNKGNIQTAGIQMKLTAGTLETYYLDNSTYPTTEQGLEALRGKPELGIIPKNWKGPYLKSDHPKDPWGNDYLYRSNGIGFQIVSLGADGIEGGEGVNEDIEYKQ